MNKIEFMFYPKDYVKIVFCDLNYSGRIIRYIYDGGMNIYLVQFVDDKGDIQVKEFYEDELKEDSKNV